MRQFCSRVRWDEGSLVFSNEDWSISKTSGISLIWRPKLRAHDLQTSMRRYSTVLPASTPGLLDAFPFVPLRVMSSARGVWRTRIDRGPILQDERWLCAKREATRLGQPTDPLGIRQLFFRSDRLLLNRWRNRFPLHQTPTRTPKMHWRSLKLNWI